MHTRANCNGSCVSQSVRLVGTIVSWLTDAELPYGYAPEEVLGGIISITISFTTADKLLRDVAGELERGEPPLVELVWQRRNGATIEVGLRSDLGNGQDFQAIGAMRLTEVDTEGDLE